MRIAFVSSSDPNNRIARSGVPYSIYHQLSNYYDVVWIKPNPKDSFFHLLLFACSRLIVWIMNIIKWGYVHEPIFVYLQSKSVEKQLKKMNCHAIFSMGCGGTAFLNTQLPIFVRADAIAPSAIDYYTFNVPSFAKKWAYSVEQNLLKRVTVFFAASEWIIEEVEKYNIANPTKCIFVPTGANLDMEYVKYKERTYSIDKPLHILFVGYDLDRKGFGVAYNTMQLLDRKYGIHASLTIIGGSPDTTIYNDSALKIIGRLDKNKKEDFDRFYSLFAESDLFLLPTKAEFHGIVNCEAAAYGLPIFSYQTGGVPSYCVDGVNGRCLPVSATEEDFANAIYDALVNGSMKKYSNNSRKMFLERFNWITWGEKVQKYIDDVLENRNNIVKIERT